MFNVITVSIFAFMFILSFCLICLMIRKTNLTCPIDDQNVNTGVNCEVYYRELIAIAMERADAEENCNSVAEYMRSIKICDERLIAVSQKIRSSNPSKLKIAS